jgi:hypothetical protein
VATALPHLQATGIGQSVANLSYQLGAPATACLLGLWVYAVGTATFRVRGSGRAYAAAVGALAALLVLVLAGALPAGPIHPSWTAALGILLGLVARTPVQRLTSSSWPLRMSQT